MQASGLQPTYYTLKTELSPKIIGKAYPQAECQTPAQAQLLTGWHHLNPRPRLYFSLNKGAKLTDFVHQIAIGATGFLLSPRAAALIRGHHLMDHQWLTVALQTPAETLPYYWLHLSEPRLVENLDYTATEFYRTEFTFREERVQLSSFRQYQEWKTQDKEARLGVEMEKVTLAPGFDTTLDMFSFLPFDRRVYVSAKLAADLKNSPLTGLVLKATDRIRAS